MTLQVRARLAARIRGFYAILDADDEGLAAALVDPAGCAAPVLQVRLKHARTSELLAAAQMARRVTRAANALLIVNDRLDVALAADADGVHLGQDDLPLAAAIHALGAARARMLIGVSTHDLAQVAAAVAGGADYLGFGPVFPTATKANPDPVVGVDGLREACARAGQVPVVAIGGVGVGAAGALHAAGAAAACAISAVNAASDPAAAARALALPWRTPPE
ncbi:MAG: thiamine phosphate synthase [Myxococcales bacterium]|nr:thiamine phosphate synthase [Myxococcales bacterium]MBK7192178.1 thiamine phosphate synthase [Myxococcales bacterium]MBP6845742.1 thiamine phosphate synthase [Kofleriaceae bacterium]